MTRTFVDTGVLIAAARGTQALSDEAMKVLDDPEREFASSAFVRLETLPKSIYNKRKDEAEFYEAFFNGVTYWADDLQTLVDEAYDEACAAGLSAMDASHVAAAKLVGANELVTSEGTTKPVHRVKSVKVVSIRNS